MRAYIVKNALSKGIICVEGNVSAKYKSCFEYRRRESDYFTSTLFRGEWVATPEEAIAAAEKRRTDRLAQLKREIAKLETMTFAITDGA